MVRGGGALAVLPKLRGGSVGRGNPGSANRHRSETACLPGYLSRLRLAAARMGAQPATVRAAGRRIVAGVARLISSEFAHDRGVVGVDVGRVDDGFRAFEGDVAFDKLEKVA